jgi:hypothetical protein
MASMVGIMSHGGIVMSPHLLQFAPTPKTVPALPPPSAELDRAATRVASPGCDAATDAWGVGVRRRHGVERRAIMVWWGGGSKKKTDLFFRSGSLLSYYPITWYEFYGRTGKAP